MMSPITVPDMLLRVSLAFIAGFALGWERERHGRPAGLRTNILACVASAIAMIVSEILFFESTTATPSGSVRADPARLGAGILTGIGFLGGGTILRHENFVRGVTTAATLWLVTVLGLAFGSGLFLLGGSGLALGLLALFVLPRLEAHVQSDWYAKLIVRVALTAFSEEELRRRIEDLGPRVLAMRLDYDLEKRQKILTSELKLSQGQRFELASKLVAGLAQVPGVMQIAWG
jgi:putative Mg2+ transporter-C (MgtC) family protein